MEATDRNGETGLIDVTSLSLSDLSELDDSVVANALRQLLANQGGAAECKARFSAFNSAL
jgi:hypothetical protein